VRDGQQVRPSDHRTRRCNTGLGSTSQQRRSHCRTCHSVASPDETLASHTVRHLSLPWPAVRNLGLPERTLHRVTRPWLVAPSTTFRLLCAASRHRTMHNATFVGETEQRPTAASLTLVCRTRPDWAELHPTTPHRAQRCFVDARQMRPSDYTTSRNQTTRCPAEQCSTPLRTTQHYRTLRYHAERHRTQQCCTERYEQQKREAQRRLRRAGAVPVRHTARARDAIPDPSTDYSARPVHTLARIAKRCLAKVYHTAQH
jgi:hypothetical protein